MTQRMTRPKDGMAVGRATRTPLEQVYDHTIGIIGAERDGPLLTYAAWEAAGFPPFLDYNDADKAVIAAHLRGVAG